jgi:hypothetical protein
MGEKYRLYHDLPFLNVFNTKDLVNAEKLLNMSKWLDPKEPDRLTVSDVDYNRLKKTSIDYTLCGETTKPILCIELDGLKDGFNIGTKYGMGFGVTLAVPPKVGDTIKVDQYSIKKIPQEDLHRSNWKIVEWGHELNLDGNLEPGHKKENPEGWLWVVVHPVD